MAVTCLGLALGLSTIPIVAISLKKCVQVNFWEKGELPGREDRGGGWRHPSGCACIISTIF